MKNRKTERFFTGGVMQRLGDCVFRSMRGVTLLELLVTLVILSIGLLGVARLQIQAIKGNHSAAQKSQAAMLAYMMLDAMRANRDAALAGNYNLTNMTCTPVSGSTLVHNDQNYWIAQMQAAMGSATCGQIQCDAQGNCTVTVQWDDSRAGGSNAETLALTSRL